MTTGVHKADNGIHVSFKALTFWLSVIVLIGTLLSGGAAYYVKAQIHGEAVAAISQRAVDVHEKKRSPHEGRLVKAEEEISALRAAVQVALDSNAQNQEVVKVYFKDILEKIDKLENGG